MKKESIFTGKTVDEALKLGLLELGITEEMAEWEIIETEKRVFSESVQLPLKSRLFTTKRKTALLQSDISKQFSRI